MSRCTAVIIKVRRTGLLAGIALLIVAAFGGLIVWRQQRPTAVIAKPAPAPVAVEAPEVTLTGRVEARTTEKVGAPVAGTLEQFFVDVNQEVYQGQLLGRIRNQQYEGAVQQAESDLEKTQAHVTALGADGIAARMEVSRSAADQLRARTELERLDKIYQRQQLLMKEGATPRLTFEKAEKDYQTAKRELDNMDSIAKQAQERVATVTKDLETTQHLLAEQTAAHERAKIALVAGEIHSPADGVVIARRGEPGQLVDPTMNDLVVIATGLTSLQVILSPEPHVLARIHPGQTVTVLLNDELPGTVREIRGTDVIVDFTSPTPVTKIGVPAQVKIKF